jgi:hypothetical protein
MPSKLINADLEVLGKITATPGASPNEVVTKSQLDEKQQLLTSGINIKTLGGVSILGSGDIPNSGGGGSTLISGTGSIDFGNETDYGNVIINNSLVTNSNFKSLTIIPTETSETSIDDFRLNGVNIHLTNIVDNTSFELVGSSSNNASGIYTFKYNIII